MPFKFPKAHRLRTKREFEAAFAQPAKVSHQCFVALYTLKDSPPAGQGGARIGLIVGKRVAKQAVKRNLIKRTIRESFRVFHSQLPIAHILVIARPECIKLNKKSLRIAIDHLWQKLIAALPQS